jgi:hypothetical protein
MLSRPLSPAYARRCLAAIRAFAQPGDPVVALCPRYDPSASCGLCQRPAIYRCFPIQNARTGAELVLGVECIQAYRLLVRKLRREKENYRDPGTIPTILKRYEKRGALTEAQVLDLLSAGRVPPGSVTRRRGNATPQPRPSGETD